MSAIVTDQFRIINTNNFIESVESPSNSYYVFLGLPNPYSSTGGGFTVGYGRTDETTWENDPPNPLDSYDYLSHCRDTIVFGKKINSSNIRRVVRRINWTRGQKYEMYRHDYSIVNRSPITDRSRLYDANYYVINSDYKVYICIDNGSTGSNPTGNKSQDEPKFTDLEPSKAGESGDEYVWKYLFTISPSDIIKFDSIEYVILPNNWEDSTDQQILSVRENGDSFVNNNQIKKVYIQSAGRNYRSGEVNILGDGTGAKVYIETNSLGEITDTIITSGGSGYTYGIVDLNPLQESSNLVSPAKLIPIIPPSRGHGYDIYKELGSDKVLIYARFDDSTKDFPTDTKFSQIGILKNPTKFISTESFSESNFSGLYSLKFPQSQSLGFSPTIGNKISQSVSEGIAVGYIASYDSETKVLKYFKDRSLYYNGGNSGYDQVDYVGITTLGNANVDFNPYGGSISSSQGSFGQIDSSFTGIKTSISNKTINLDTEFINGVSKPEINKKSGDVIYIDNRPLVERNPRQKEDIKIILEF